MTTYLEPSLDKSSTSITALSRFPTNKVGQPLLSILQAALNGVIIVDAMRRIVLVNDMIERIFGYPAQQLLEQSLDLLLPSHVDRDARRRRGSLAVAHTRSERSGLELKGLHANGTALSLNATITGVAVRGKFFLALILQDADLGLHAGPTGAHSAWPVERRRRAVSSQQASEVEKKRFSRKLYDDIGQRLSVLKLDLDWLENSLSDTDQIFPARLAQMQGLLDNVISMTKSMASALRPPLLDDFGLLPAVEWMAEAFRKKSSIVCSVKSAGMTAPLDDAIESAVFRVVQEGLSNIERHAHAQTAEISLLLSEDRLDVMIQDDGIGLAHDSENKPGCYGLIAMQERVFVLGGTITIRNIKPHGVAIQASIPIEPFFNYDPLSFPPTRKL